MNAKGFFGLFLVVPAFVVGCSSEAVDDAAVSDGALHSATDCPATIEVEVGKPTVMTDAKLLQAYERDFTKWGSSPADAATQAKDQLDASKGMIAQARADKAVKLRGERAQACAYKTFDAKTGQLSDYSVWLSNDGKELRVSQGIDEANHELYMSVPVKKLSQTELTLDSSKDGTVYAEDTSSGHDGSDGWSAWIGYAKITGNAGN